MKKNNYILFWLSQAVSQLGTSLTGFALIFWIYGQTKSVMSLSLMIFCHYVPYVIVSMLAGAIVDRSKKKTILIVSDFISFMLTALLLVFFNTGNVTIWMVYMVNIVNGFTGAFQSPASSLVVKLLVDKDKLEKVSGLNSFTSSLITVITPVLAASFKAFIGVRGILVLDMATFIFAFLVLLFGIKLTNDKISQHSITVKSILEDTKVGIHYIWNNQGIKTLILSMALINFFSRLTYENTLTALILFRTAGNEMVLGLVNSMIGFGGIIGGIIVTVVPMPKNKSKQLYGFACLSFLLGDILMGLAVTPFTMCLAGLAASLPIPMIVAAQNVMMYTHVPDQIQGRVFAAKNTLQFFTIPIGTLLGGYLAEYVFEPFMLQQSSDILSLSMFVGSSEGSGIGLMFLITGILGTIFCLFCYNSKVMHQLGKIDVKISSQTVEQVESTS